ncbi:TonB-dependent receptor [Chryseobacterium suipulveris]|uniref:TonB-dependent receptor n=1 Tax=Chryseobacterium suipulveris TaxID=2929800 RepID=A0ABY4BRC3_9FLAO|nr:TonB-dependent receptor [Chryseobacterium suipulveris]UOE41751.1 TonB-dependent receptor [Chryseobacterium suipulveris]
MTKEILSAGLMVCAICGKAQMMYQQESDTLRIQEIEDIHMHRTGNPNQARISSFKSNIPAIENPQPIAVVAHEVIEQQQSKQLSDVIRNVNGLYLTSSRGGSQDSFGGRGFTFGNENMFKNGSKVNSGMFPEVSALERVEVLKGANAMLYGNVAPGGIINMITKKPRFNFGGSVGMSAGSWNTYKPTVDIFGPLSKKVAFRMNGTYEYANSFRDVVKSQKHYFNPSFAFNLGENTQIILEADYLKHDFTPDFGIGSLSDYQTMISSFETGLKKSDFLGANWQYQTNQMATTDIIVNHQLNDNWMVNSVIAYQNYTKDYFSTERIQWYYNSPKQPDRSWLRPLNRTYNEQNLASLQINLNGEFKTGKLIHKVLFGTDGDFGNNDGYTYFNPSNGKTYGTSYLYGTNGNANGILLLDDPSTWISGAMPDSQKKNRSRIETRRFGFYAQDFLEITKQFKVLGGIRYSNLENKDTVVKDFVAGTEKETPKTGTKDFAFSPKAGLVFTPTENFTVYGTYTNSFVPNSGFLVTEEPLKPSIVDQFEVGLKKNLFKNSVAVNLNVYQIDNRNTYTTARFKADGSENSDSTIKEFAGKVRSRGVELDITGNPTPQLSLIGGISYNHAVYTETPAENGYVENQRLVRTPATTANMSVFYKFDEQLKGLILGASAFYTGDRKAGWNDTKNQSQVTRMVDLKGFATVDFSLGYDYKNFLIQGKIGNVFNAENFNVHENYSVNPIAPRNFYFTLTYKL